MENNEPTQLSQNVFERPSSSSQVQQPRSGVGQDKGASSRERIASLQPAPLKKEMRSQQMNRNTSRTHSRPTPKRKTVHLTLWVKPVVKAELQRIAEREGVSVSAAGGAFLERAMQTNVDMQYGALFRPIIEQAIRKQMRSYSTRIALLLVRVAFDAGQTRNLVTNILGRQPGVSQPVLEAILNSSSKAAKGKITRSTPQLEELIAEVERWFHANDEDEKDN